MVGRNLEDLYSRFLGELEEKGLLRAVRDTEGRAGGRILFDGRELVNFASNDYLGLSASPALMEGAALALKKHGAGAGASRLLSGGTALHALLEAETARFFGTEDAIAFNSGYHANLGAIPALASLGGSDPAGIFTDRLNHASIIDACRLSKAKMHVYRHADTAHLETLLAASPARLKIIITESVFSMDGDKAPLAELYRLACRHGAILYIDEAHAVGVMGGGRGLCAESDIPADDPRVIIMGTYAKAFGSYGAFVAGSRKMTDCLRNTARTFIFSTALPPAVVGASLAALRLAAEGGLPLERLWEKREKAYDIINGAGLDTGGTASPIIPVLFDTVSGALHAAGIMLENGVYAPAIRPPTVKRPRLRLSISAAHSGDDLERLADAVKKLKMP